MKNLYRLICLVLSMVMLLSVTSVFAENKIFSDVKENGKYSEAIYTLTDIGLLKGDAGADTFRPEANISREEFSVIMTRFLNVENLAVNTTTYPFNDVTPATCADWSIKATKLAYDLGIIKGYGDGNFGPKDPVTYEQAVKMIVCSLGYEKAAEKLGGWPQGYITVAINNKITSGAEYPNNQPAPREIIAQLIFNALEVNMVSDTATDPNAKYTILKEKLGLTKAKGIITANGVTSLDASGAAIKEDQIEIDDLSGNRSVFNIGESASAEYLGQQVNYYYKEVAGENVLTSVRPTNTNKSVTFDSKYIRNISATEVQIYDDPDGDTSLYTSYELANPVYTVYNEKYYNLTPSNAIKPTIGSITLKNFNNDNKYDVIEVTATRIFVVKAVDTSQKKLYNLFNPLDTISTAPSSQKTVTVTRGKTPTTIDTIQKDDVLLVSESLNPSGKSTLNIEIITKKITGKISATNISERQFEIDGKIYEASTDYVTYATGNSSLISIGDDVVCFLDENDIIIYAIINDSTATSNYICGYILGAEHKVGGATSGVANVNVLNASGKEITYKLSSRVEINGTVYSSPSAALSALDVANDTLTNRDSATGTTQYVQLVKYVVNTSNEISIILTMDNSNPTTYNPNKLTLSKAYNSTGVKYSPSSQMLGTIAVDKSTVVYTIPTNRDDTENYSVGKIDSLNNSEAYKFEAYDANQGVAKVILLYGVTGATVDSTSAPIVVVQSIVDVSDENGVTHQLTCYQDGIADKKYIAVDTTILSGIKIGDVIKLAFDTEGKIKDKKLLFSADTQTVTTSPEDYTFYQGGNNAGTQDAEIMTVYGTVYQAYPTTMYIAVGKNVVINNNGTPTDTSDDTVDLDITGTIRPIPFSDGAVYYIYDTVKDKLTIGSYAEILDFETAMSGAAKVFTYSSYGKTKFVIVCK